MMMPPNPVRLFTGEIWHMLESPWRRTGAELAVHERGALAVDKGGKIIEAGEAVEFIKKYPGADRIDFGNHLIIPGFVDAHLHFPQLDMIGAHGESLLQWLERYIYPAEQRLEDDAIAQNLSEKLLAALAGAGVTCAAIYSSPHLSATEILFEALLASGMTAVAGKSSMDRNAPQGMLADPEKDAIELEHLVKKWHGREDRLWVAATPRFAPGCSEAMLAMHGALRRKYENLFVQTHLAETPDENEWVNRLFTRDVDYLAVYERHGLVGPRTLLGHCIHLNEAMMRRIAESGAAAVHCPTSNFFLGSGLAPLLRLGRAGARIASGSDIGAGTSLSTWRTLAAAYETGRLRNEPVGPEALFWLGTLGGAEAMRLHDRLGNFEPGKQADFQVIAWENHPLLNLRMSRAGSARDRLAALIAMGDERVTREVHIAGRRVYGPTGS